MPMSISLCVVIVSILLLSLQASGARHLGVVLHSKDPAAQERRLILNLSDEIIDDGTKWEKARKSSSPSKENVASMEQRINVEGDKKHQEQDATKAAAVLEAKNRNVASIARDDESKIVKSQVDLSGAPDPVTTVSWRLPHQQKRKKRKKTNPRVSHHPEFTLDYAPPRVHPPCHN